MKISQKMKGLKAGILLAGTVLAAAFSSVSFADTDTMYTLEWVMKKYPSITLCKGLVIEDDQQKCILPGELSIEASVYMFTNVRHLILKNPNEYVRFVLPQKGYVCRKVYFLGYKCEETKADSSFWQFYFMQKEGKNVANSYSVLRDIEKIQSIIDRLNKGIEKGEIAVEFKYELTEDGGYGTFVIHVPQKYLALLKEYTEVIGEPAVIGIRIKTPLVEKTLYYELHDE